MYSSIWMMSWALMEAATPLGRLAGEGGLWRLLAAAVIPVGLAAACGKAQKVFVMQRTPLAGVLPAVTAVWAAGCMLLAVLLPGFILPWETYLYWALWAYGGIVIGGSAGRRCTY